MNSMWRDVCWAEGLKLRRSKVPMMAATAYAMAPLAAAILLLAGDGPLPSGFLWRQTLIAQVSFVGADWPGYFSVLASASALGGMIIFGLIMIWIFGREQADQTAKELLTLPLPRPLLVGGKVLVAGLACLALQAGMLALALVIGAFLGLPVLTLEAFQAGAAKLAIVGALTFCLSLPFGLMANLSRGLMAAVGSLFLALFYALIFTALGWGAYFPWSIPALFGGAGGDLGQSPGALSYLIVFISGLAGLLGNMAWWRWADHR